MKSYQNKITYSITDIFIKLNLSNLLTLTMTTLCGETKYI